MPTIERNQIYPEIDRYWNLVENTLKVVFHESANPAEALRSQISGCSAEEQLLFYHEEPLNVATDLVGRKPTAKQIAEYHKLADKLKWKPS